MWHPRGGQPRQSASHDLPLSLAINPPPRPAGSPSRPASDRTDFAKTTTSERSLGGSSTIYPRRSNKGDGGGSDAYNDLDSGLVELRDDVLPLMLLLAMFPGCSGLLTSSSILLLSSHDQSNKIKPSKPIKSRTEKIFFEYLKQRSICSRELMMDSWFE